METVQFSKTQLFVEKFLSTDELYKISESISSAYSAVNGIFKATPALGAFLIGADLRPHLLRVFVEHLLQQFADTHTGFTHEVRQNVARNCNHLRIYKDGLALTSHYMGAKSERPEARKALHKANLTERNRDLFEFENNQEDPFNNIGYAQILHGGITKPTNILINIPNRNQSGTLGSMPLIIIKENKTLVEEIIEETPYKLKEVIEELKNGTKKIS